MAWYKCSGGGEGIPLITRSGAIVNYEDTVGGIPINDLTAEIVPIQASGTPSPSNPLPISGFSYGVLKQVGKNLIVAPTYATNTDSLCLDLGEDKTVNSVTMSFLAVNSVVDNISSAVVDFRESNGTHHYKTLNDFKKNNVSFQPSTQNNGMFSCTISNITFRYVYISYTSSNRSKFASDSIAEWQVEVGSSATTYEAPTTPTTDTASFGQTIYGGTWLASQGKVIPRGFITFTGDNSESWSFTTSAQNKNRVWIKIPTAKISSIDIVSNMLVPDTTRPSYPDINKAWIDSNTNFLIGVDSSITSATAWKTFLASNNLQLVYELATPTEINVEAVNFTAREGTNNIFSNTGNLTAKFYKSTVDNLETLVEQTKDLAPDVIALASSGNKFDLTDDTTGTKATKIANYMFYKNANVENISLSTIEEVGEYSFEDCKYIKGINLPNCTTLKKEAFYNACQSHTSTTLPSVAINLPKVTVVNDRSLSQIGYANGLTATLVLTACTEIKANGIRGMGSAYMRIAELLLPNLVTLGQESFNYNVIETIDIGENCTTINSKPFNYCTITNLIVRATTPPTLHNNGLGVTPTHIYVPSASVETYKTTSNWSTYASVIEAIPS